jgi:transposase
VNVLKPHLKATVATLLANGSSQREIERRTGVDRKTIRRLMRQMLSAPLEQPNSPTSATDSPPSAEQTPPPRPPTVTQAGRPPAHARSSCEPHRQWIEAQVRLGRNATAIYQELVDRFGFSARYNSVKRFCRALRKREPEQFDRLEFTPGEEAQVDYGEGAPTRHPSGRYRKPRLFVMTLRYSRRSFRKVVWTSSSNTRHLMILTALLRLIGLGDLA